MAKGEQDPRLSLITIAEKGCLSLRHLEKLEQLLVERGNFSPECIRRQLGWFCLELGIDDYYFRHTPLTEIAGHIESLYAAMIISENNSGEPVDIHVFSEKGGSGFYMLRDDPGEIRQAKGRIESHYSSFRLESYISRGYPLRLFNVNTPVFPRPPKSISFESAASREFLKKSPRETVERYRTVWEDFQKRRVPLLRFSEREDTGETRIMIALEKFAFPGFFTAADFVFRRFEIPVRREYVEPFADNTIIHSVYIPRLTSSRRRRDLQRELICALNLPEGELAELFFSGDLSAAASAWVSAAAAFAHQFLTTYTEEYTALAEALSGQPEMLGLLGIFKTHLAKDTYHEDRIRGVLAQYPDILNLLYAAFRVRFDPERKRRDWRSRQLKASQVISSQVSSEIARHILEILVVFNQAILKTNFFTDDHTSLAFRLRPDFLNSVDYPVSPWGIFYLVGHGFRGFHIRFRDIARGGIRFVPSATPSDYDLNSDFIFDENYNLALTQQRKNKDIPEGGAKGTFLTRPGLEKRRQEFFRQYIDGLLDLILPNPKIVDYLGETEILFLGPDEGTADLMDWAALHAKNRGYPYWRAFTTGKSRTQGGIPHDIYGMTTQGVRSYVEDIISVQGWEQERLRKFQTGGPDGDLGSNEIKLSRESTVAIIDGSGVLFDPEGLDRRELLRLAQARLSGRFFRSTQLSPSGCFVGLKDHDFILPDGTLVSNGTEFRNSFHFFPGLEVDLFVPCGGRPQAININNWERFLNDKGDPKAKVIVEGANLFITQEARLRLEESGVILIKDASANKGGVTSSSLEVLVSLVLTDDEYSRLMMVKPGRKIPSFRSSYISQIIRIIRENSHREFKLLWSTHKAQAEPLSLLSDRISDKINRVTDLIRDSELSSRRGLREKVIRKHCPSVLLRKYPPVALIKSLPLSYYHAFFAASLASDYVYERGLYAGELDFYQFVGSYGNK